MNEEQLSRLAARKDAALEFAKLQLINGRISEEDVNRMTGERRALYENAMYYLDIDLIVSPLSEGVEDQDT